MCKVWNGVARKLYHGLQYVSYNSLRGVSLSCFGLDKKYHVEHFTCSLCSTLFGPQDSYYEHDGDVYCHFHYSTRFATKCAGCNSAILKQFVEINRNMRDECWHPECYMINKVSNLFHKLEHYPQAHGLVLECQGLVSETNELHFYRWRRSRGTCLCRRRTTGNSDIIERKTGSHGTTGLSHMDVCNLFNFCWLESFTVVSSVLSAFEESSAACISDMLRQVSNGAYLDAIRMAEKFILHVEVLFGTIDDLEFHFASLKMKGL